jgi:phenylacetate-CoA ligase
MVPAQIRLGKRYLAWLAHFEESEAWSVERVREYQLEQINSMTAAAAAASSRWADLFRKADGRDWGSLEEFSAMVPAMDRKQFKAEMCGNYPADIASRKYQKGGTSGTTGQALQLYHLRCDADRENAAICHQWKRVGFDPFKSTRAEFRGLTTSRGGIDYLPDAGALRFNILDFSVASVERYASVIGREKLRFYHGYPSALALLALAIKRNQIAFPQPEAVLLASEIVYDWQLAVIEEVFPRARLFAHYGCAERTVLGGWCETSREYHMLPTYSYVEWDPLTHELLGTNFHNTLNPFVRYRMSDVAEGLAAGPCPACGRSTIPRLKAVAGRMEDYLFSVDKGWIPPAIVTYPLKNAKYVREVQIVQNSKESVEVRYTASEICARDALLAETAEMKCLLQELMGLSTRIEFARVDGFERGPTGKFRWIVSTLKGPGEPID